MEKIKVLIVDDHVLFSQALQGLIAGFKEFEVVDTLSNGRELINYFINKSIEPDVVLMDIQMPLVNGIEATEWLKNNKPNIKVLALSMEAEEDTILKMLRAGAKGYLLKDINPSVLKHAINEVFTNGIYYTENVASTLLNSNIKKDKKDKVDIKERELEFLKLACTERTYKEIADLMFLSPKTIDNYREALFDKLNVKSRIGMVLYAIKEHIVEI